VSLGFIIIFLFFYIKDKEYSHISFHITKFFFSFFLVQSHLPNQVNVVFFY
jgi:hypothetical protein